MTSGTDEIEVPGPMPDDLKDTLGFPRAMRIMLDARTPDVSDDALGLLFHVEHLGEDVTTWGVAFTGGCRIGIEFGEDFTTRVDDGQPPASIAGWVDDHWERVVRGSFIPYTEARS
ncbi:unannotated protein [freshwater metagenome]|uniref:Unannotated protein n=1 Tax=freshwater metagenome TaxID=449393 RepID=A0A6J7GQ68_9ZZZZ|nr:hypothetical protein [Actinomycetota bacterium]